MSFTANLNEIIDENRNGQLGSHLSWSRVQLADVAEVLNGFPFDSDRFNAEAGHPVIRIRDVVRGTTRTFYSGAAPEGFWIDKGEILIGMDGDFNAAIWKSSRALLNQRVLRLKSQDDTMYDGRFLFHVIGGYLQAINAHTSSVTVKHLSSKTVLSIPLPLPPIEEQKRIAQKLDALLAQVDTLKARIDAIPALLKRFRQSVLASAASSSLTSDWRKKQNLEEPRVTQIAKLANVVRGASPRPAGHPDFFGGPVPWITVRELTKDQLKLLTATSDSLTEAGRLKSRYIESDTLLLSNSGATLGVPKITRIGGCINDGVVALLDVQEPTKSYLYYFLSSKTEELRSLNQGAAQPNLNTGIVKSIEVRIGSEAEQAEIVRRVEQLFAYADQLEAKVATAQQRIDALTQSLLAKAFRGELVPQDPGDEPASVLLERIRAQRAASPKPKRGRKAATS